MNTKLDVLYSRFEDILIYVLLSSAKTENPVLFTKKSPSSISSVLLISSFISFLIKSCNIWYNIHTMKSTSLQLREVLKSDGYFHIIFRTCRLWVRIIFQTSFNSWSNSSNLLISSKVGNFLGTHFMFQLNCIDPFYLYFYSRVDTYELF